MSDRSGMERVPSGIPGLDTILRGGFPRGGIHIIQGLPGTGKTTLANQIAYAHAREGGRVLYATLLSESHTRLLLHLGTYSFFDETKLPSSIAYISGFGTLEQHGLAGLAALLRRETAARHATMLVIDGFVTAEERAGTDTEFKKFIQELQIQAEMNGCTAFLLTTSRGQSLPPEHTMVDGIVELTATRYASRTERGLYVNKLRGSGFLEGRHPLRITGQGIVLYPRIEAAFGETSRPDRSFPGKLPIGVPELDLMLHGGVPEATVAAVVGASGVGKTMMGLQYLSRASAAEPGLLFGFYETPPRLLQKAAGVSLDLEGAVGRGDVEIVWQAQGEHIQDALAQRLLEAVDKRGVRRLFLDGLSGFMEASVEPDRISRFFAVLTNELRARGVTTLYTMETRDVVGSGILVPVGGISSLVESMIALRFVEHEARMRRLLSIIKVRDSGFDPRLRELVIHDRGLSVAETFDGTHGVLSGFAWEREAKPERP